VSDPQDGPSSDQTDLLEQVIFKRELNEVYLLIDFISGRPDQSLDRLTDLAGPGATAHDPPLSPPDVISTVCQFRYPPAGTPEVNARDAAFLLRVKDKLNRLASPAGAFSIAFTNMFVGWRPRKDGRGEYSRLEFARLAYPTLERSARRLRLMLTWLSVAAALVVVIAGWTSWHVALGQSLLQRLDDTRHQLEIGGETADTNANTNVTTDADTPAAGAPAAGSPRSPLSQQVASAYRDVAIFKQSGSFRFLESILDPGRPTPTGCKTGKCDEAVGSEQAVAAVLSVYTRYVLPMLFGLLGTIAAAVRDIQSKVQDSTLSPRDFALSLVRLPLGVMAGLAVGLFLSPSAAEAILQSVGISSAVTLTAGGLAFLAGYGAEACFRLLDQVITVKFAFNTPANHASASASH
jgi:hypothetical protein